MGRHTAGMVDIADILGGIVTLAVVAMILEQRLTTVETVFGPILLIGGRTNPQAAIEDLGTSFTRSIQFAIQGAQ